MWEIKFRCLDLNTFMYIDNPKLLIKIPEFSINFVETLKLSESIIRRYPSILYFGHLIKNFIFTFSFYIFEEISAMKINVIENRDKFFNLGETH